MAPPKVVFCDRDGVINLDSPGYIKTWAEFAFAPGSLEALHDLHRAGWQVILITNQSMIGRGIASPANLLDIHARLCAAVERTGGRILDIFHCPHRPDENCACRKPKPGLIQQACARHGLTARATIMIGDKATDIACGRNAGCGATIRVATAGASGFTPEPAREASTPEAAPDATVLNLRQAVDLILSRPLLTDP